MMSQNVQALQQLDSRLLNSDNTKSRNEQNDGCFECLPNSESLTTTSKTSRGLFEGLSVNVDEEGTHSATARSGDSVACSQIKRDGVGANRGTGRSQSSDALPLDSDR
jgi:hypothetical protein